MIPHTEAHVWGVLWELDEAHEASLDRQEGVPSVYNRKEVEVECGDGVRVTALTYFLIKPEEQDKRPSGVDKNVIVRGAEEHGIPSYYVAKLRNVEDNGYMGEVSVNVDLRKISKVPDE